MRTRALSLRWRLLALILTPLILIALAAGGWRFVEARATSAALFDRTLIAVTLAVARDVAVSEGDALSSATRDLIRQASGGEVFYHASGPDGTFITGYAYPPVGPPLGPPSQVAPGAPALFDARYRGAPVRVARLVDRVDIGGVSGLATVTVWQPLTARSALTARLAYRALAVILVLIGTVAVVVWFGVQIGLRPLNDLRGAVERRSSDDLGEIRRAVPVEVSGLVTSLNALFRQLSDALTARDRFISDAAHQLRNPMAGMLTLAEAAEAAPSDADRKARAAELAAAARQASRLTQQLLSLERLRAGGAAAPGAPVDLAALARGVAERNAPAILANGIEMSFDAPDGPVTILGEPILLEEAVQNLIDNAATHGGADLSAIDVAAAKVGDAARLTVSDDGVGVAPGDSAAAFGRFSQIAPSPGSGLGLAIVKEIAELHGGRVEIEETDRGARLAIYAPLAS